MLKERPIRRTTWDEEVGETKKGPAGARETRDTSATVVPTAVPTGTGAVPRTAPRGGGMRTSGTRRGFTSVSNAWTHAWRGWNSAWRGSKAGEMPDRIHVLEPGRAGFWLRVG